MGDRCWLQVTLHGQITSMRQLAQVVLAFKEDGQFDKQTKRDIVYEIASCLEANNGNPEFTDDERNYANVDSLQQALQEAQMPYLVDHADGGGYCAMTWCWTPDDGKFEVCCFSGGGGAGVGLGELEYALGRNNPLKAVEDLYNAAKRATGTGMPPFTVSCERSRRYLAKVLAAEALGVAS